MDYTALGQQIRAARTRRKLTQQALARKVGVSTSFIGHIERGTRVVSLETFVLLCRALNESPNRLLETFSPLVLPPLTPSQQQQLDRIKTELYLLVCGFEKR